MSRVSRYNAAQNPKTLTWFENDFKAQMEDPANHKRVKANEEMWQRAGVTDNLDSYGSVLDVGCHGGHLVHWLRSRGWAGRYYGLDLWLESVAISEKNFPNETFIHGDINDIAKLPVMFDLVWHGQIPLHEAEATKRFAGCKKIGRHVLYAHPTANRPIDPDTVAPGCKHFVCGRFIAMYL